MNTCQRCGLQSATSATFCTGCGAPLTAANPPAVGRPVISMRNTPQQASSFPPQPSTPTTFQASTQFVHQAQSAPQPFANASPVVKGGSSSRVVALAVIGLVVLVAGIVIFASGNGDEPQRATPSDEKVTPVDTAAEEIEADSYTPVGDTYPSWDDFPYDFRSSFLDSCTQQGDYSRCLCALETMESRYTIDEVLEVLDAVADGEDATWFYSDITSSCF